MEKKNYIVAIDLGSSNAVVAVGSKAANNRINIEAMSIKPSRGIEKGEVKNVEQAAQSLKEAVEEVEQQLGIKIVEAYTGISGQHLICNEHPYYVYVGGKDGEIFKEDVERLNESMADLQAPEGYRLLDIIPQNYVVDDAEEVADPVGMFGQTLGSTFNLIIGENTIISRLEKALQKIDIKAKGMYINPVVMANAVTFPDEKDLGVAVIDIGAGTTDICIYHSGIIRYVGVIPLGADAINKDIRSTGILDRHVEDLKIKYGCAVAEVVDQDKLIKIPGRTPSNFKEISFKNLASIIEARLMDISEYVMQEIKESKYEGKLAAGIILTGGCSDLAEIQRFFKEQTKMEVRIAVPQILVSQESLEIAADPKVAAAIGIIYQAMEGGEITEFEISTKESKQTPEESVELEVEAVVEEALTEGEDQQEEDEDGKEEQPEKVKKKRKGFISRWRNKIEDAFDMDPLDDNSDTTI